MLQGAAAYSPPMAERSGSRRADDRAAVRRVVGLFRPYRSRVALIAVLIVGSSGLGIVTPFLTEAVFDRALFVEGGPQLDLLWSLVGAMVAVTVVSSGLGVWQTYLTQRLGNGVMRDLRDRLYEHLQAMELAFFTSTRTGEIQSRLDNDVGGVQAVVTDTASTILANVVTVLSALIAMLLLSWRLTLVAVALLPVFVFLQIRVGRMRRRIAAQTQASQADMAAITQESLSVSGVLLAKVYGRQATEIDRYRNENARQADLQVRQTMTGQSFFATVQAFFGLTPALVYLVTGLTLAGGFLGGTEALTAGTVVAFTTLQNRLLFPIVQLLRVGVEVSTSLALFGRVFEYLDLRPSINEDDDAVALDPDEVRGHLRYDHVTFRYPGANAAVLRDLDIEILPGQLAAFVGPSGAGKTTASYLASRLYDAEDGAVLLDGVDLRRVSLSSLARTVGAVTQESYLFHSTVRENLRYAREDATDDEIEAAARAANIHDRITTLDDGYDTTVGERGYRLSGGEKQRLAIARVILADPRVLILDEATSALDTTSERLVQQALEPLMQGRTTIAIAHRLSTILAADLICVFDQGRVVERGTHDELLTQRGLYAQLYAEQFGGGEVEARCEDGVRFRTGEILHHRSDHHGDGRRLQSSRPV